MKIHNRKSGLRKNGANKSNKTKRILNKFSKISKTGRKKKRREIRLRSHLMEILVNMKNKDKSTKCRDAAPDFMQEKQLG
jgi:hypothetical protein